MQKRKYSEPGFSLLEMAMVLLIMGIFFSLSVGSLDQFFKRKKLELAAEEIVSQIAFLKYRSIIHQIPYRLSINGTILNIENRQSFRNSTYALDNDFSYDINGSGTLYINPNGTFSNRSLYILSDSLSLRIVFNRFGRFYFD